ncbi:MAG: 50S ribosomal protein L9 [SAR202 cluster bacterium]|nr:50S ribosomal protein L9 [SAR202 cluster bacterium]|tara:strand:+ start:16940 stop:17485 length:546 start_codon:yes stop_codon:yes gene_type:complete
MRVIFLDDVPNVARAGDVKDVKNGYARNFLLPKGIAVAATSEEMKRIETIRKVGLERQSKLKDGAQALVERLESSKFTIKVRSGPNGRLYGAVTNVMIAEEVSRSLELDVDRRDVMLAEPIHETGSFEAKIKVHPEISANIRLSVEDIDSTGSEVESISSTEDSTQDSLENSDTDLDTEEQ